MGSWREHAGAPNGFIRTPPNACCCFGLARPLWTMVVANRGNNDNDDRADGGGGGGSHPAPRWGPDSQGEETSAAEMLQSLQPVRDLAQNFDIDIAT